MQGCKGNNSGKQTMEEQQKTIRNRKSILKQNRENKTAD